MSRTSTVRRIETMWMRESTVESSATIFTASFDTTAVTSRSSPLRSYALHRDIDRIALLHPAAPRHVDEARLLRVREVEQVAAVGAVDAHTAPGA